MPATYASVLIICSVSLLAGRAILALCGRDGWSWLEPAVGFAALMTVAGVGARLFAGGTTATILVVCLALASVAGLRIGYRRREPGVGAVLRGGLPVAAAVLLALSLPFAVSGRWGLIGVGFNNDLGLHLAWSEWLRSGFGPSPDDGYPLGPHGIAIAVAAFPKIGLGQAFVGEVISISVLTGLTALAALQSLGALRRSVAAVLVAVSYLAASYYAQAAFKETTEALFVLAYAIALPGAVPLPAERGPRLRAIAPLLVLAAGIFFSYSFAGLAWPVAMTGLWALTMPAFRRGLAPRALRRRIARPATLLWVAALGAAVVLLAFVGPFAFAGGFSEVAGSNTYGAVSPLEALGVWPAANYRLSGAGGAPLAGVAGAIGVLAALAALAWWIRRREIAIPVALAACVVLYLVSLPLSGNYSQAKALMIASPLLALIVLRALLSGPEALVADRGAQSSGGRGLLRAGWAVLGVLFLAGAAYSSFLALRETSIGPPGHGAELAAFRPLLQGKDVLYAGQDRYAAYALQGADSSVPVVEFPDPEVEEGPTKPFDTGDAYSPIDFDSFTFFTLNHHKYIVTGSAAWNSQAPANFEEVARTHSYVLYKQRSKAAEDRRTLLEGTEAAARVDCVTPEMKIFVRTRGEASVFPDPVVFGDKSKWDNGTVMQTGEQTAQTLDLPPGRWRLSIQYFSPVGMTLSAPGLTTSLPPALDGQRPDTISLANDGQYWPAGVYRQEQGGPVRFTVAVEEASTMQRLTGYDGESFVGHLVAVRDLPHEMLPLAQTCGRWIDWYRGRSAP